MSCLRDLRINSFILVTLLHVSSLCIAVLSRDFVCFLEYREFEWVGDMREEGREDHSIFESHGSVSGLTKLIAERKMHK